MSAEYKHAQAMVTCDMDLGKKKYFYGVLLYLLQVLNSDIFYDQRQKVISLGDFVNVETRAGESVGAGCFWLLGAGAAWEKKSGAGVAWKKSQEPEPEPLLSPARR